MLKKMCLSKPVLHALSANKLCKQYEFKISGLTVSKLFDPLLVFLKEILKTLILRKISRQQKYAKFLIMQRVCLFVCFVALRSKSTAMVMVGRSVHLIFSWASLNKRLTSDSCSYFHL